MHDTVGSTAQTLGATMCVHSLGFSVSLPPNWRTICTRGKGRRETDFGRTTKTNEKQKGKEDGVQPTSLAPIPRLRMRLAADPAPRSRRAHLLEPLNTALADAREENRHTVPIRARGPVAGGTTLSFNLITAMLYYKLGNDLWPWEHSLGNY